MLCSRFALITPSAVATPSLTRFLFFSSLHLYRLLRDEAGKLIDVTEKDITSKGATEFGLIKQVRDTNVNIARCFN